MALKNLQSNLAVGDLATTEAADLTYGKGTAYDRPGEGFSNEPFIKGGINLGGTSRVNSITGGFIRGGLLMHAERLLQDTARIGKFLISNRGITWNAKQLGLQKSNPKISEPSFSDSVANQRQWNFGVNTLAQVVGQGTGLHIKREGISPLDKSGYIDEKKFLENNGNNKLINLYDSHILIPVGDIEDASSLPNEPKSKIGKFFQNVKSAFSKPGEELYSYQGGPGSTYGIGQTKIQKYAETQGFNAVDSVKISLNSDGTPILSKTFDVNKIIYKGDLNQLDLDNLNLRDKNLNIFGNNEESKNYHEKFSGEKEYTYQRYNPEKDQMEPYTVKTKHFDTIGKNGRVKSRLPNYLATLGKITEDNYNKQRSDNKSYHREERVNLGNPGGDPTIGTTTVDLINALDVFNSDQDFNSNHVRDLIRFRIEAVDPLKPTKSDVMVFRAFLDSMGDTFSANYNEFSYNGRAENFYTYNSFNRDVNFNFKIAAQSSREMKPLYRKLNYLLSNTAPEYNKTSNRMMTPFMRLTIGSYFQQLPGVIKSVGITWQKDYPWEITLDAPEGGTTSGLFVLPHVLDVSVTYQPIHDFLPQKGIDSPFIVPHKDSPIANTPGRKLWNSEPRPIGVDAAAAKIK